MTKMNTLLMVLFSLFITSFAVQAQTAKLQVIHNAADPAANKVDIYLNGSKLLDDFAFRTATPFIDALPIRSFLSVWLLPPAVRPMTSLLHSKSLWEWAKSISPLRVGY